MNLEHNTVKAMEVDGKMCLVACFPILSEPQMVSGKSKKGKEYTIAHAIEPFWLPGAGFEGLEGSYTIQFQASQFVNKKVMFGA